MKQILRNIVRLHMIDCRALQDIDVIPGMGAYLADTTNFTRLPLVGLAACEVSSVTEDRSKKYTSVLTCLLSEDFDPANRPLAFMMETLQGERFLVGLPEAPYPVVNTTDNLPGKMSESSGCRLTVQWTSTLGLIRIHG